MVVANYGIVNAASAELTATKKGWLSLFYFAGFLAALALGAATARITAVRWHGPPSWAVGLALGALLVLSFIALFAVSVTNCCHFGEAYPLNGGDCGC